MQTHRCYYQETLAVATAASAFKARKRIEQHEEPTPSSSDEQQPEKKQARPGRCPYTREGERAMAEYFVQTIRSGDRAPTLALCRAFLSQYPNPNNHTPKNIQDHIRHMMK